MSRTLTAEAKPVGEDHILGLRETAATAEVEEAKLTWCHGFGYGGAFLSIEVDFPDGSHVSELMPLTDLMQKWAREIIREKKNDDVGVQLNKRIAELADEMKGMKTNE